MCTEKYGCVRRSTEKRKCVQMCTENIKRRKEYERKKIYFDRIVGECYLLNRGFAVVLPQKQLALI